MDVKEEYKSRDWTELGLDRSLSKPKPIVNFPITAEQFHNLVEGGSVADVDVERNSITSLGTVIEGTIRTLFSTGISGKRITIDDNGNLNFYDNAGLMLTVFASDGKLKFITPTGGDVTSDGLVIG